MTTVAVVIAGGRSLRFGSDKAMAEIQGRPMIAHVVEVLGRGCGRVAVNCRPASRAASWAEAQGLDVLVDPPRAPDAPLTGVLTALEWTASLGAEVLVTAPCDTPALPEPMTAALVAALGPGVIAAFAETSDGTEPLCAAWRPAARMQLKARLQAGQASVRDALAELGAVGVRFHHPERFTNVNTTDDLARETLRRTPGPGDIQRPS
jgi:molybdopterin-guanine dinucleotide biosynthesis protein A